MAALAARLGLTPAHVDYLWTVVAVTADPRLHPHVEALAGPPARRGLGLSLYTEVADVDDETARALSVWLADANPLVTAGLVHLAENGPTIASAAVAASERLVRYLAGEPAPTLPVARLAAPVHVELDDDARAGLATLAGILGSDDDVVVVIEGPRGSGRRSAAALAAPEGCLSIDARATTPTRLEAALRALTAELTLSPRVPVNADIDDVLHDAAAARALAAFVGSTRGPVVLTTSGWGHDVGAGRPVVRVTWRIPDVATRTRLWMRATALSADELESLAMQYPLGPEAIRLAVASASAGDGTLSTSSLVAGVRHNIAERLSGLADRVEVRLSWDDLVLADDTLDQIRGLIARVRHRRHVLEHWGYSSKIARGIGVPALFSGPPGTGKTMVAGLIARELGLDLYQVELGQVVSKWVGETEKNLGKLFDAAQEGHALLLFDEADALFGQRSTDVKGAVDRYANLEVNYLLQRVEAFDGITILTTNLEASIDRALKRRLAAHIVFDAPDEDERIRLWQRLTSTSRAPLAHDLDAETLARDFPNMTGANIRNAALTAAYLAAAAGSPEVTQAHLVRAARAEYRSMGRVLAQPTQGSSPPRRSY